MRIRDGNLRSADVTVSSGAIVFLAAGCVPPPPAPAPPIIDFLSVTAADLTAPALVPFAWKVRDPNGDTLTCRFDGDGDGTWDDVTTPCTGAGGRTAGADEGAHTARLEVSDGTHAPVTSSAAYNVAAGLTETFDIVTQFVGTQDPRVTDAVAEAVDRWTSVLSRGVPDTLVQFDQGNCMGDLIPSYDGIVDDIVIDVIVMPVPGFMGDASWCVLGDDGLPRLSFVRISTVGLDWLYENGQLTDLVAHEIGHALGIGSAAPWATFTQYIGEPTGYVFTGPRAVAEWHHLGGVGTAVPLSRTSDHWDETSLQNELMTCYIEFVPTHPTSAITVAALADLGFHVDIGAADAWTVPPEPGLASC